MERIRLAVNANQNRVIFEVGNYYQQAKMVNGIEPITRISGPVKITEITPYRIVFESPTTHFHSDIDIYAVPGTPFTMALYTGRETSGYFEFRGVRYEAGGGSSNIKTFNATLSGFVEVANATETSS